MGEGGTKCIKYLIFFFNFLFFVFGIVLLGFGIYAQIKIGAYASFSSVDYITGSRLLIAVGSIIAVVSFFGCCGAWKESKCLLGIFFVLLLIMLGLEIAAAVLGYKSRDKIEDNIKKDILKAIKEYPGKDKDALDDMQRELKCCGASGFQDWLTKGFQLPPKSCKCEDASKDQCSKYSINLYYKAGCADKLKTFLHDNLLVISALAITLLVIQILGMVFALILISRIGRGHYA
ncbi:tetraspanin-9-like [Actinia tenebrosa]|uniref:Tetraspanin n=1 Tax=Actinia tenebrosa TaxID=6105 RepID=A0A6P8J1T5_ACTTE|nr:tetraspanin-9-like [Actinia tenebrosa]